MRNHRIKSFLIMTTIVALVSLATLPSGIAQEAGGGQGAKPARVMPPIPRLADGTPSLGWVDPKEKGVWRPDRLHRDFSKSLLDRKEEGIPLQPWAKALYDYRVRTEQIDDPEGYCLPAGGVGATSNRTAAPWEFLQMPEQKRIVRILESGTNTWQHIYMDGRPHPQEAYDFPTWMGHAVGHWEGDTLVVDTVGFNEGHWLTMMGLVRTNYHHVTERFTRVNYDTLRYEATFDDPGAYTRPWRIGWDIQWGPGESLQEIVCQENNKWPELHKNIVLPQEQ
jgi:hypothetical protein